MTAHPTATGLDVSLDGVDARFATAGNRRRWPVSIWRFVPFVPP